MVDILSESERSALMSKVASSDTKPEWIVRCGLHRLGFRYNLKNKHLPGSPDLVFPKYRTVVFVHGCFWHRHPGCKDASTPKSNQSLWAKKFSENLQRDARAVKALSQDGWNVLIVWECELMNSTIQTIEKVAHAIRRNVPALSRPENRRLDLQRREVLTVAEKKVRYRIDK